LLSKSKYVHGLNLLILQKYPRDVRFQAITDDNTTFDWYQSRAVCETLGQNLAIIKTEADMMELNTTVSLSKLHQQTTDIERNKFYYGLFRKTAAEDWKWYTGETLDVAWPYWQVGQPDSTNDNVCARVFLWDNRWLLAYDSGCDFGYPNIICE